MATKRQLLTAGLTGLNRRWANARPSRRVLQVGCANSSAGRRASQSAAISVRWSGQKWNTRRQKVSVQAIFIFLIPTSKGSSPSWQAHLSPVVASRGGRFGTEPHTAAQGLRAPRLRTKMARDRRWREKSFRWPVGASAARVSANQWGGRPEQRARAASRALARTPRLESRWERRGPAAEMRIGRNESFANSPRVLQSKANREQRLPVYYYTP